MNKCPICGHEVEQYHEVTFKEPYTHNIPYDGLIIYGAYAAPKLTICQENNFLHFAFIDANGLLVQHRLVQLGVENPTTKSPSEEYMEGLDDDDESVEEWPDEDDEEFRVGSLDY
jgi:hypothetical protein